MSLKNFIDTLINIEDLEIKEIKRKIEKKENLTIEELQHLLFIKRILERKKK